MVEGTDSEAKMTGGWDRSNVVPSQHHREGHTHTVSVWKGTEEEELKDRVAQVDAEDSEPHMCPCVPALPLHSSVTSLG